MSDPESPLFQPLCSVPKVIEIPSETSECEKSDLTLPPHGKTMGRHTQELVHIVYKLQKQEEPSQSFKQM